MSELKYLDSCKMRSLNCLAICFLLITGCVNKVRSQTTQLNFIPDTTINRGIILNNPSAIVQTFGDVMPFMDANKTLPEVSFLNKMKNQYLKLLIYPGSKKNRVSYFEVGVIKKGSDSKAVRTSSIDSFSTESGIRLGMSNIEVIRKKGKQFAINKKSESIEIISYQINDFDKGAFLKRYNMPVYTAIYTFEKGKQTCFSFGFEYP